MPALGERRWEDAWRGVSYCAELHPNLAGCQVADATSTVSTERETWGASGAVSAHRTPRAEPGQVEGWRGGGGLSRNSRQVLRPPSAHLLFPVGEGSERGPGLLGLLGSLYLPIPPGFLEVSRAGF